LYCRGCYGFYHDLHFAEPLRDIHMISVYDVTKTDAAETRSTRVRRNFLTDFHRIPLAGAHSTTIGRCLYLISAREYFTPSPGDNSTTVGPTSLPSPRDLPSQNSGSKVMKNTILRFCRGRGCWEGVGRRGGGSRKTSLGVGS
jgi:hypothetical protein